MWEVVLVQQCVARPPYSDRGYNDYGSNPRSCQRGATDQCAVRMSLALGRAGFGLESSTPRTRVLSGNGACQTNGLEHALGAVELATHLERSPGAPQSWRERTPNGGCAFVCALIQGQTGILDFNNCFTREGSTVRQGDHIDLFHGRQYYNEIIHPRAAGGETTGGFPFGRAGGVRFWRLS